MSDIQRWIDEQTSRFQRLIERARSGRDDRALVREMLDAILHRLREQWEGVGISGVVQAVLTDQWTGRIRVHQGTNIITDAGDIHYAQRGAAESPTNFTTAAHEYGTAGDAPAKGSNRSNLTTKTSGSLAQMEVGYPATGDPRGGADIVTWRSDYAAGTGTDTNIDRSIITNWAAGTPGASEPVLNYGTLTAFTKGAGDSLEYYTHHTMNGV